MLGNYRSFDGEEISYLFLKGKKTIIFLHPLGTDWTYWKKTVAYFAKKGYGAVVPTLKGHSPERTKLKHISVEDHVRDIELLEEKLKLKNPVIIGCSIGGAIAAAYHTKHPAARCICINTPFDSAPKAIWLYFDIYAFLFMPIAMLLSLFKRRDFDFSRSKITNAVLLTFKTALKLHYRGVYLNYFWLRKLKGVKDSGVVKLVSRQDEVITPHYEPDYEIDGNHNCVISESNVVNPLLLKIIEKQ